MRQIAISLIILVSLLLFSQPVFAAFGVSSSQSQLTDTEELTVDINLDLAINESRTYYLRAAFYEEGTTSYFGYTKNNNGDWYNGPYSQCQNLLAVATNNTGDWTGSLTAKIDKESNFYKGAGNYLFKVGRYTQSCSSPTWSDGNLTVQISQSSSPTPTPSPTPSPTPTPTSPAQTSSSKSPTPTPKASPTQTVLTPSPTPKKSPQILGVESTGQATSQSALNKTPSPTPAPKEGSPKTKIAAIVTGSGAILIGLSFGFYLWYKRVLTESENQQKKD